MIMSRRSTSVQIFISIRSAGDSPHIGEILRFCDFFLVCCILSRARTQIEPVDRFSRFMAHTTNVFSPKDGPFGACDNIGIHLSE